MKLVNIRTILFFTCLILSRLVFAHGGVPIAEDTCVAGLGKYRLHFTAYSVGSGTEYCWDLPVAGKTLLVFDLLDTRMRAKRTEVKVVETPEHGNASAPGRTMVYLPARPYPTGIIEIESEFEEDKRYSVALTVADGKTLQLALPLQVIRSSQTRTLALLSAIVVGLSIAFVTTWSHSAASRRLP